MDNVRRMTSRREEKDQRRAERLAAEQASAEQAKRRRLYSIVVGGVLVLWQLGQSFAVRPLAISKLSTALQILLVATALLLAGAGLAAPWLLGGLVWIVAFGTVASAAAYAWKGVHAP